MNTHCMLSAQYQTTDQQSEQLQGEIGAFCYLSLTFPLWAGGDQKQSYKETEY